MEYVNEKEPWERLVRGIVCQAVKDYRLAYLKEKKGSTKVDPRLSTDSIEKFFKSEWFYDLTHLNGEKVVKDLSQTVEKINVKRLDACI